MAEMDDQDSNPQHLLELPPEDPRRSRIGRLSPRLFAFIESPLFLAALGLVAAVISGIYGFAVLWAVAWLLLSLSIHRAEVFEDTEYRLHKEIISSLLIGICFLFSWRHWLLPTMASTPQSAPSQVATKATSIPSQVPTPAYYPTPLTLRQLFDTDFKIRAF